MASPADIRLAWAVRAWDAEVGNASRLATRVNIVLTVALAFAGAGTKVVGDALSQRPADVIGSGLLCGALLGIVAIFYAFVRVLTKRQTPGRPPTASAHLLPPEDAGERDGEAGIEDRAFLSATAAAYELHARNAEEKARLAVAQQWLLIGAALTLLCGAVYTWIRAPQSLETSFPSHLRRVGGD